MMCANRYARAYLILEHTGGVHGEQWFQVCNALVVLAIVLTFPLQLVPVMEVVARSHSLSHARSPASKSAPDDGNDAFA